MFFTADQHYGHQGVIDFVDRPFSSVSDMDDMMIWKHNERVSRSDDVYMLGDFSISHDLKYLRKIFDKLNGRKHLIIGNHEKKSALKLNWSSKPSHFKKIKDDEGRVIVLSHYSQRSWDGMYKGAFHFYGHTHGRLQGIGRSTDVGVDAWDFGPVTAAEAIERMMVWNPDFETYAPEVDEVIRHPAAGPSVSM